MEQLPFEAQARPLDDLVERRWGEAQRLLELHGAGHLDTLLAFAQLATAQRLAGRFDAALRIHRMALAGLEEADRVAALAALSDQGITLTALGQFDRALDDHERAFGELSALLGRVHYRVIAAGANFGYTLQAVGRARDALDLYRGLAQETAGAYGPDHLHTDVVESHLAGAYGAVGDLENAQILWYGIADRRLRLYGARDTRMLAAQANLAETLRAAGMLGSARSWHERVLGQLVPLVGEQHLSTLSVKEGLAMTLAAQGEAQRAQALAADVVRGRTSALGPLHPQTLAAMRGLTHVASTVGDVGAARRAAQHALEAHEHALGESHPDTLAALGDVGETLASAGEAERAGEVWQHLLARRPAALRGFGVPLQNVAAAMTAKDEFLEGAQPPLDPLTTRAEEIVSRTPHLDVDAPEALAPGVGFHVDVWADRDPSEEGESARPIELELPPGASAAVLDVWLVPSLHFEVVGDAVKTLTLDRCERRSDRVRFELRVAEGAREVAEEPRVTAAFAFDGRPCGRVARPVSLFAEPVGRG